jgi:hypothetical protein
MIALAMFVLLATVRSEEPFDYEDCKSECGDKFNYNEDYTLAPSYGLCMQDCAHRYADYMIRNGGHGDL